MNPQHKGRKTLPKGEILPFDGQKEEDLSVNPQHDSPGNKNILEFFELRFLRILHISTGKVTPPVAIIIVVLILALFFGYIFSKK